MKKTTVNFDEVEKVSKVGPEYRKMHSEFIQKPNTSSGTVMEYEHDKNMNLEVKMVEVETPKRYQRTLYGLVGV